MICLMQRPDILWTWTLQLLLKRSNVIFHITAEAVQTVESDSCLEKWPAIMLLHLKCSRAVTVSCMGRETLSIMDVCWPAFYFLPTAVFKLRRHPRTELTFLITFLPSSCWHAATPAGYTAEWKKLRSVLCTPKILNPLYFFLGQFLNTTESVLNFKAMKLFWLNQFNPVQLGVIFWESSNWPMCKRLVRYKDIFKMGVIHGENPPFGLF